MSHGLDSLLAARLIKDQGFEVVGLHFKSPFFGDEKGFKKLCQEHGFQPVVEDITEEFLNILEKGPKHGFGKVFNPCIDCKILMFKKAKQLLGELGCLFIVSGEVVGQRPFSQRFEAIRLIEKEAGVEGLVIRPLSARFFKKTRWEEEGIVDRSLFPSIRGRGRKIQLSLAKDMGIKVEGRLSPAGGCLLADPTMGERYRILFEDLGRPSVRLLELVKKGRFFRLDRGVYVFVGRNRSENEALLSLAGSADIVAMPVDTPGPTAVVFGGDMSYGFLHRVGRILVRYIKKGGKEIRLRFRRGQVFQDILVKKEEENGVS